MAPLSSVFGHTSIGASTSTSRNKAEEERLRRERDKAIADKKSAVNELVESVSAIREGVDKSAKKVLRLVHPDKIGKDLGEKATKELNNIRDEVKRLPHIE